MSKSMKGMGPAVPHIVGKATAAPNGAHNYLLTYERDNS